VPPGPLTRLRKLCLALPETSEKLAWGTPTFRVKDKIFAMWADADTHVGDGRNAVWIMMEPENQSLMIKAAPKRFFKPPYVGPSGWLGVYLDARTDWRELKDLLHDGWRRRAPKRVLAQHGADL